MGDTVTVSYTNGPKRVLCATAPNRSLERLCREHISAHPTDKLTLNVDGNLNEPHVHIMDSLILVGLHEALYSKAAQQLDESSTSTFHFKLPVSIWSIVSLIVVLSQDVTVKQWFERKTEHMDETLPAHTLQVRILRIPSLV